MPRTRAERDLPYSVGEQPWQAIAEREAAVMAEGTVLLDLSPFSKFDISGSTALHVLNRLSTAQLDVRAGRAVYTLLLNEKGGIEADVTITRTGKDSFRLVSGAATRQRDLALLRRAATGHGIEITDRTETHCCIGVMGAGSRRLMMRLSRDDWRDFEFSTVRTVVIAGVSCMATRISYVGELGWELTVADVQAAELFDALIAAGAKPMGHHALNGCRMEKGYRHWGHDIGPDMTPLEAGLGFTIDWIKYFDGRHVLERQRDEGLERRLLLFDVAGHPLILHDEPVFRNGKAVGMTTSGAKGVRTGRTLALGLVTCHKNQSLADVCSYEYEIEVAGVRYAAKALLKPPFDPSGVRMRT